MNSTTWGWVQSLAQRASSALWIALIWLGNYGCVDIQGGAVELSWSLRTFEGSSLGSCSRAGLDQMRLCWAEVDGAGDFDESCFSSQFDAFPCGERMGATSFEIEPGPVALWLEPVCDDAMPPDPGTYEVPAPIVRQIEEGRVATLDSLLIVVTDNNDCQPPGCTCVRE